MANRNRWASITNRLNGINPLAYLGVQPSTPAQTVHMDHQPSASDLQGFNEGAVWIVDNVTPQEVWVLTLIDQNGATWSKIYPDVASTNDFFADNGNSARPVAGAINFLGGPNINTEVVVDDSDEFYINLNYSITQPPTSADGSAGLYSLGGNPFMHSRGVHNTFLGESAGTLPLIDPILAIENVGVGYNTLNSLTSGYSLTFVGSTSGSSVEDGVEDTGVGAQALQHIVHSVENTAIGFQALRQLGTTTAPADHGDSNIAIGYKAGYLYTGDESDNIVIGSQGVLGDVNQIRIGTQGAPHTDCYIAGIWDAVAPLGAFHGVPMVDSDGKLVSTNGTDGQVIIGATAGYPEWASFTSGDGSITFNVAANSIDMRAVGGGGGGGSSTFHTDAGDATVDSGAITIAGVGEVTTSGAVHTVSVGLTQGTDGQLLIGSTGADAAWANLTSSGGSITITPGAGTLNIEAAGVAALTELDGDTGAAVPNLGVITIAGDGTNTTTVAGVNTVTVYLNDNINLPDTNVGGTQGTFLFNSVPFMRNFGTHNTFLGGNSGNLTLTVLSALDNTACGYSALQGLTTGAQNVAVGSNAGFDVSTAFNNCLFGFDSGQALTTGGNNVAVGMQSLNGATTGTGNICIGYQSGKNLATSDSNNILIGNDGVNADSGYIKIGTNAVHTDTKIAGIYGATTGATKALVTCDNADKLSTTSPIADGQVLIGSATGAIAWANLTAGANVTINNVGNTITIASTGGGGGGGAQTFVTDAGAATISGTSINILGGLNINTSGAGSTVTVNLNNYINLPNTTSMTNGMYQLGGARFMHNYGTGNTFLGSGSGNVTLVGANNNTGLGNASLASLSSGDNNTAAGYHAGTLITSAGNCSIFGYDAGDAITSGGNNSLYGYNSGTAISTGVNNSAYGYSSLSAISTGGYNSCFGQSAGSSLTAANSSNILIGNTGTAGDNNKIRIGTTGSGNGQQNACHIAGIYNTTPGGGYQYVVADSTDKLSTISTGPAFVAGKYSFYYYMALNAAPLPTNVVYFLGTKRILTSKIDNTGGNFYPGDGLANKAYFQAPATGIYFIGGQCYLDAYNAYPSGTEALITFGIERISDTYLFAGTGLGETLPGNTVGWGYTGNQSAGGSGIVYLTIGDKVQWLIGNRYRDPSLTQFNLFAKTYVYGYQIA